MSNRFFEIVSGERVGPGAALARGALSVLSRPYAWAVAIRNRRFDRGHATILAVSGPVISVGNLTVGGTGKTPLVEAIARRLEAGGQRVAIVGRGYGAPAPGELNDELELLRDNLPRAIVLASPDRAAGARRALEQGADVVVLDDGFQHRRLARDLDVVAIDAACPFGYGRLLPRGLLREPPEALARAGALVITRADRASEQALSELERELARLAPHAVMVRARHRPVAIVAPDGSERALDELRDRAVVAFSGLARNEVFFETVRQLGARLLTTLSFPDHHRYEGEDLRRVDDACGGAGEVWRLTTQKDAVKLRELSVPVHWLKIEMTFDGDAEAFWKRVQGAARRATPEARER